MKVKKKFKLPLYPGEVKLYQNVSFKKLQRKYNLNDVSDCHAFTFAIQDENGYLCYCMVFEKKAKPEFIAHECDHLVNAVFQHIGAKASLKNDEHHAYLLGWLVKKCHKHLKVKRT